MITHLISVLTNYKYLLEEQSYLYFQVKNHTTRLTKVKLARLRQLERWVTTPVDQQPTLETHQAIKSLPTRLKHVYRRPKSSPSGSRRACLINLINMNSTSMYTATKRGTLTSPSTMNNMINSLTIKSYRKSEWLCKRKMTELKEPLAQNPKEKHPQPWCLSTRVTSG